LTIDRQYNAINARVCQAAGEASRSNAPGSGRFRFTTGLTGRLARSWSIAAGLTSCASTLSPTLASASWSATAGAGGACF
jgi:hypothetical protein